MSEEQLGPIAIDRLTGQPYEATPLTLEELKETALAMGKPFNPPPENIARLTADLANGAQVLYTQEDVLQAITEGTIPEEWQENLIDLVVTKNDIAIIPKGMVEAWSEQQKVRDLVAGRRRRPGYGDGECWYH